MKLLEQFLSFILKCCILQVVLKLHNNANSNSINVSLKPLPGDIDHFSVSLFQLILQIVSLFDSAEEKYEGWEDN